MDPRLTSLEVIGMAIRSEEDASKFYGRISKMIANPEIKKKYVDLAREEVGHKQTLLDLYREVAEGLADPPAIPGSPETAEGGDVPPEIQDSIEDLLKLAIEREREAYEYYSRAARQARDPSGQRVLQQLADIEHGHEVMLEKELKAFMGNKDWYVHGEDEDLIHEGP